MKEIKIDIIGKGNVGNHLYRALRNVCNAAMVDSRKLKGLRTDANVYFLCVSDAAIAEVAGKLDNALACTLTGDKPVIAHTSGTTPLLILSCCAERANTGVFYPLQTFTKHKEVDFGNIPVFIEGDNEGTTRKLERIGKKISRHVERADSRKREVLHVASVFCCNFANHLWMLAERYLARHGIDFDALRPLLMETALKACEISPRQAQTGPASRRDIPTLERHIAMLESEPYLRQIYSLLSDGIMKSIGKKGLD